jgi:hypothetical protein
MQKLALAFFVHAYLHSIFCLDEYINNQYQSEALPRRMDFKWMALWHVWNHRAQI